MNMDDGAVTTGYSADRATVLRLLDQSLATELVCVLRCRRHYFMARGIHSQSVAQEFLDHSNEEQAHADQIAERIVIDSYRDIVMYLGDQDPPTRRRTGGPARVLPGRGRRRNPIARTTFRR